MRARVKRSRSSPLSLRSMGRVAPRPKLRPFGISGTGGGGNFSVSGVTPAIAVSNLFVNSSSSAISRDSADGSGARSGSASSTLRAAQAGAEGCSCPGRHWNHSPGLPGRGNQAVAQMPSGAWGACWGCCCQSGRGTVMWAAFLAGERNGIPGCMLAGCSGGPRPATWCAACSCGDGMGKPIATGRIGRQISLSSDTCGNNCLWICWGAGDACGSTSWTTLVAA
mmetsp:Transcript_8343/g.23017  ORF Transcript_8343/g.23017 Transcript_8343/m.23017 type:complete len:224 (+) Transcript_8343:2557-3228(+)